MPLWPRRAIPRPPQWQWLKMKRFTLGHAVEERRWQRNPQESLGLNVHSVRTHSFIKSTSRLAKTIRACDPRSRSTIQVESQHVPPRASSGRWLMNARTTRFRAEPYIIAVRADSCIDTGGASSTSPCPPYTAHTVSSTSPFSQGTYTCACAYARFLINNWGGRRTSPLWPRRAIPDRNRGVSSTDPRNPILKFQWSSSTYWGIP